MSKKHPVIAVTGSSGAGTTTVKRAFEHIFYRDGIKAAVIEGDSFHRYDRAAMKEATAKAAAEHRSLSHFGPEANVFDQLEGLFRTYGETGGGKKRYYIHSDLEAVELNARLGTNLSPGQFTPWEDLPEGTDLLFYEGLHGLVITEENNVARQVDLGVGVVPIVNLEWIQKIHRDNLERGYSAEAIVDIIMRRMPDYIKYITPTLRRGALYPSELRGQCGRGGAIPSVLRLGLALQGTVACRLPMAWRQGSKAAQCSRCTPILSGVADQALTGRPRQSPWGSCYIRRRLNRSRWEP